MTVYAVYLSTDSSLVLASRTKSHTDVFDFTPYFIERYDRLTLTQVRMLPYGVAKDCENKMRSYL